MALESNLFKKLCLVVSPSEEHEVKQSFQYTINLFCSWKLEMKPF